MMINRPVRTDRFRRQDGAPIDFLQTGSTAANNLSASGLGWIDVHLLAAARLSGTTPWTRDRRLASAARRLNLAP